MTGLQRMSVPASADRAAVISLALAVITLVILLFTFRGLVFLTLPLSAIAFLLGTWGAVIASRPSIRAAAIAGLVLGLLTLLISIAALAADLTVSNGYDVYELRR